MEKGFILSLIFAGIVGLFALNNSEKVAIDLILTKVEMSQAIVIFISAFLGAIIVAILGWVKSLKSNREIKELIKDRDNLEEEKRNLVDQLESKEKQIMSLYKINSELPTKNEEVDNND